MLGRMSPTGGRDQLLQALEELRSRDRMSATSRVYRILFANFRFKLGAVGLAGLIWAMSFLAAGTTIRSVTVPIELAVYP